MSYDMYWVEVDRALADRGEAAFAHLAEASLKVWAELRAIGSPWSPYSSPEVQLSEQERAIIARRQEALDTWVQASPFYFRLNGFAMEACRQVMRRSGMAVDSQPPERLPDPRDYDPSVPPWTYQRGTGPTCHRHRMRLPDTPEFAAYLDDAAAVRQAHRARQQGIPLHKLTSGDGWHVTPGEIGPALRQAPEVATWPDPRTGRDEPIEWWIDWLQYLRGASAHGGFEVW